MAWLKFLRIASVPGDHQRKPPTSASAEQAPSVPEPAEADHLLLPTLLGISRLGMAPMTGPEQQFVDHIDGLRATAAAELPRLPVVLPQLMRLLRRDDAGPRALAECVARDPALVGEVVRLANGAGHAGERQVADLSEAVALLGGLGLTQLVSRVALRPVFAVGLGQASAACGPRLWALAERGAIACGVAAASIGGQEPVDPFHAYLAGLTAHVGAIVAVRRFDALERQRALPDGEAFYRALRAAMAHVAGHIGRQWQFPEPVCGAVEQVAGPAQGSDGALTAALRVANRAAQRHLLSPASAASGQLALSDVEQRCHAALERAFGK